MVVNLQFAPVTQADLQGKSAFVLVGEKELLKNFTSASVKSVLPADFVPVVEGLVDLITAERSEKPSVWHKSADAQSMFVVAASLSSERTRNTGTIRSDLVGDLVSKSLPKDGNATVLVLLANADQASAVTSAISRSFPLYSKKTGKPVADRAVHVGFVAAQGQVQYAELARLSEGVRLAARLVDTPPSELNTDTYVDEVTAAIAKLPSVKMQVIRGEELKQKGFGGLWGVGKASEHLPALVILSHAPAGAKHTTAWVGKGIVYDTGGLSIKGTTNMCSMKSDMGGSAAIFAAFVAAVNSNYANNLHALLCLAENSVDARSTRNDDILYMYSGKTVEVNNTDAEGRLVLADGVAYATKHLSPDIVLDMATLTGAQLICTGEKHAAILCNNLELERTAYDCGQQSGDWVFPILYSPELLKKEFNSEVADMKNSVKSRSNAQSSCAGHFIEDHLHESFKGKYIHVDIAGPSFDKERGTGFGVALLLQLLKNVAPK